MHFNSHTLYGVRLKVHLIVGESGTGFQLTHPIQGATDVRGRQLLVGRNFNSYTLYGV